MVRSVKFILQYPEVTGLDHDMLDCGDIGEIAALAEATGFAGISFTEHPVPGANWLTHGGHQTLDPFVALAFAAAATERLRLLTYLAVVPYRNPFLLAKSAASLDRLSNGRFTLGVGTGYHKTEFFALGVDFDERNDAFDEALDVLPLAWSGEPFSYAGRHFEARNVVQRPRPAQQPIPIWIGGNSQRSRRRVAARAQGWMPMGGPPELASTTRTPHVGSVDVLAGMIAEVKELAGERAASLDFVAQYQDPGLGVDPGGDAARHRDAFAGYEAAGITWLVVGATRPTPEQHRAFIETFGAAYLSETGLGGDA
jgi:probable F420-dependent oxidoreductase